MSAAGSSVAWRDRGLALLVLALPFALLHWMVPFVSEQTIGQDYPRYAIATQMELMFAIHHGTFPLFMPGFFGGQTASALILGELHHPLSHLAAALPGYWSGAALELNTLLRLVSLGLSALAVFWLLRRLAFERPLAFVLAIITVFNLRMLDDFRYAVALETHSAFLLLCVALARAWLDPGLPSGGLAVTGAAYLVLTSGQPQLAWFAVLGAGAFALSWPYHVRALLGAPAVDGRAVPGAPAVDRRAVLRFWGLAATSLAAAGGLAAAHILPFYVEFLRNNAGRANSGYEFSLGYTDTLPGTLYNFVRPYRCDVSGAYGGPSLPLIAALLPLLAVLRIRVPRVVWAIWSLFFVLFLYTQGARTSVHWIFWSVVPFFRTFRIPGRISLLFPLLFLLLLAWVARQGAQAVRVGRRELRLSPAEILAGAAIFATLLAWILPAAEPKRYTPLVIRGLSIEDELLIAGLGVISLAAFAATSRPGGARLWPLLVLATGLQTERTLAHGTFIEPSRPTPTFAAMREEKRERLDYRGPTDGSMLGSRIVAEQEARSYLEPELGKIFRRVTIVRDRDEAYARMGKTRALDEAFLELPPGEPLALDSEVGAEVVPVAPRVELTFSSYNRMVFSVTSSRAAYFGLSYPYSGNWVAALNGAKVPTYRVNGAAHAVRVPPGTSTLEFRYESPSAAAGTALSCGVLAAIGAWLFVRLRGGRRAAGVVLLGAALVLYLAFDRSLYAGESLGTRYVWPAPSGSPAGATRER